MTKPAIQALWDAIKELQAEVAKLKRRLAKIEVEKEKPIAVWVGDPNANILIENVKAPKCPRK